MINEKKVIISLLAELRNEDEEKKPHCVFGNLEVQQIVLFYCQTQRIYGGKI